MFLLEYLVFGVRFAIRQKSNLSYMWYVIGSGSQSSRKRLELIVSLNASNILMLKLKR